MKIGFSFGRCLRDIVEGKVVVKDVICIIARTRMNCEDDVEYVINSYMRNRLFGLDKDECKKVGLYLFEKGLIHQPRLTESPITNVPEKYIWMDLFPTKVEDDPMLQQAWNNYRMLLKLTNVESLPDEEIADQCLNINRL